MSGESCRDSTLSVLRGILAQLRVDLAFSAKMLLECLALTQKGRTFVLVCAMFLPETTQAKGW